MSAPTGSHPSWLFLPGTLCDARVFDPLRAALADVSLGEPAQVLPDLNSASRSDLADRLVAGTSGSFYVVGFSLGCQVAFEIMRKYPSRCVGLVLISTTARADAPELALKRRQMVQEFDQLGPAEFVENSLWNSYVASPETASESVKNLVVDMACKTPVSNFSDQIELAIERPSSLNDLSHFSAPVLMINGAQDVLTPPEFGKEIAASANNGSQRILTKGGHFVLLEEPQATADAIQEWVRDFLSD